MLNPKHFFLLLLVGGGATLTAAPGSIDPDFVLPLFNNNAITDLDLDSEGNTVVVGSFTDVGSRITKISPTGEVIAYGGFDGGVRGVAVDAAGAVFAGGDFTKFNGLTRRGIARILPDASLDPAFDPGTGFTGSIYDVFPAPGGKVIAIGAFYQVQGQSIIGIVRLNADGSLDETFGAATGTNNVVNDLVFLPDGRILIGGAFTTYNGTSCGRIAVLTEQGDLDATMDLGSGFDGSVSDLLLLDSGKILVAGSFSSFDGTPRQGLARLNADGTLDGTFNAGAGPNAAVNAMIEEAGGRLVIGGSFTLVDGVERNRIARLLPGGGVDLEFDPGTGASSTVEALLDFAGEDRILVGGAFSSYNEEVTGRLTRIIGGGYEAAGPGGYPTWIASFYPGAGGNAGIVGEGADPDSDGIPNLLEYALGGDPTVADSDQRPVMSTIASGGETYLRISFTRRREAWDVIYFIEGTDDLVTWEDIWSSADHPYSSPGEEYTEQVTDTVPMSGRRFIRLAVMIDPDAVYEEPLPGGEGLNAWLAIYFDPDQLNDPAISGPNADPDGDGIPNLLEYAFGGNPSEGDQNIGPASGLADTEGNSYLSITFVRLRDASDLVYSVEASPDLDSWTEIWNSGDHPYVGDDPITMETVTDTEPATSEKRFLRVNVSVADM